MKLRTSVVVLTALFGFNAAAVARVGEDEKQIEARYGKPQKTFSEKGKFRDVGYAFEGFVLAVTFIDGISRREGFALPNQTPMTDDSVKKILAVSAGEGATWQEVAPQDGARFWRRSDGAAVAVLEADQKLLSIQDGKFEDPPAP
ncbi:MAG: hypothetical protein DMF06_10530 [Verrucomicrobia bacterium]|jgi:hypothetical protein|nr:MAG: hypothetical protein DMF06_10530 [Verrucomicrobiota bacterium]